LRVIRDEITLSFPLYLLESVYESYFLLVSFFSASSHFNENIFHHSNFVPTVSQRASPTEFVKSSRIYNGGEYIFNNLKCIGRTAANKWHQQLKESEAGIIRDSHINLNKFTFELGLLSWLFSFYKPQPILIPLSEK